MKMIQPLVMIGLLTALSLAQVTSVTQEEVIAKIVVVPQTPTPEINYGLKYQNATWDTFSPETYLDQILGITQNSSANLNLSPEQIADQQAMDLAKQEIFEQLQIQKSQLMLNFQMEMEYLQQSLNNVSAQLTTCNWTCVNGCSVNITALQSKIQCLQLCGCYATPSQAEVPTAIDSSVNKISQQNGAVLALASIQDTSSATSHDGSNDPTNDQFKQIQEKSWTQLFTEAGQMWTANDVSAYGQAYAAKYMKSYSNWTQDSSADSHSVNTHSAHNHTQPSWMTQYQWIAYQQERSHLETQRQQEQAQLQSSIPQEGMSLAQIQIESEVQKSIQFLQDATQKFESKVTQILQSSASSLNCNSSCVSQCSAIVKSLDQKAQCLEVCNCYSASGSKPMTTLSAASFVQQMQADSYGMMVKQVAIFAIVLIIALAIVLYSIQPEGKKKQRLNESEEYLILVE